MLTDADLTALGLLPCHVRVRIVAYRDGWLVRWWWSDCPGSFIEVCPGGVTAARGASLCVWN